MEMGVSICWKSSEVLWGPMAGVSKKEHFEVTPPLMGSPALAGRVSTYSFAGRDFVFDFLCLIHVPQRLFDVKGSA
jgi:hypothetical protein